MVLKSTIHCNNQWYICKLLTNYELKRIWPKGVRADKYFELCDFSRENTNIETYGCTIISMFVFDLRMEHTSGHVTSVTSSQGQ
jgi:hypothetical protein